MTNIPNVPIDKETGAYMPRNDDEVLALVQYALDQRKTLRCKASGHAWPPGIASGRATFEEGFKDDPNALYQVPTQKTGQVNVRLDDMVITKTPGESQKIVKLTREEADEIGLDWEYTWKNLNGPGKDYTMEGGLFRISGGLVLGSNEIDGGSVSIKDGALYNLDSHGHALFDLGGIYSQTVAGYLSTGAAGGSTKDSIEENILAYKIATYDENTKTAKTKIFRKMGGAGKAASQEEIDTFHAYATSLGLFGVTLEVYVRGIPRYAIVGYEVTTKLCDCEVDLFGNGLDHAGNRQQYSFEYHRGEGKEKKQFTMSGPRLSMEEYLKSNKYTRLEWWPEKGVNRVTLWKGEKIEIPEGAGVYPQKQLGGGGVNLPHLPSSVSFEGAQTDLKYPTPYQNGFLGTRDPKYFKFLSGGPGNGRVTPLEVLSSLLLTILGNLNNLANVEIKWTVDGQFDETWFEEFEKQAINIVKIAGASDDNAEKFADALIKLVEGIVNKVLLSPLIVAVGRFILLFEDERVVKFLYNEFAAPLSTNGGPQQFTDIWFEGLPMDKDVNYAIIPVVFTELWFPINRSLEVMKIVERVFDDDIKTLFAIEFYAGAKSDSWLSASGPWPDSVDEGEDGAVLRVDVYYFPYNSEPGVDPRDQVSNGKRFYSRIWNDIRIRCAENKTNGKLNPIPFKFHLGKYAGDIGKTQQYKKQYKKWEDWQKKRQVMDPYSIFTNDYWSEKLRINYDDDDHKRCCYCG